MQVLVYGVPGDAGGDCLAGDVTGDSEAGNADGEGAVGDAPTDGEAYAAGGKVLLVMVPLVMGMVEVLEVIL